MSPVARIVQLFGRRRSHRFAAIEIEHPTESLLPADHSHQEFLKFLRRLDAEFPANLALHLVMDNYGTHNHPNVKAWLKRHPRFVAHFVPTSSSWLNLVERWFGELTAKAVRCGSFGSVAELECAITQFLDAWNQNPKPQALPLDRHRRIHSGQTRPLPPDLGADQARLYRTAQPNKKEQITSYFSDTTLDQFL